MFKNTIEATLIFDYLFYAGYFFNFAIIHKGYIFIFQYLLPR